MLRHPQIERRHAEVYVHGKQVFAKDLGSRFGTFVGKERVADQLLNDGDIVTVATFRYAFRSGAAPA
jgi:pSer/pThr/pTyr-binding forkhead associated (FHA) protein